jgi:hypothetical protein
VLVPYKDDHGRWQFFDMSYFFPWSQWQQTLSDTVKGDINGVIRDFGLFTGPIPTAMIVAQTGIDPFSGRPVANEGDPLSVQIMDYLNWAWSLAAPTWVTEHGALGKLASVLHGKVDRYGDPQRTTAQALLSLIGINAYPIEPELTRATNIQLKSQEIQDTKRRMMTKVSRETDAGRQADIVKSYTKELERRVKNLEDYVDESEVAPRFQNR